MSSPLPAFLAKPCLLHIFGKSGGLAQAIVRILKNRIPEIVASPLPVYTECRSSTVTLLSQLLAGPFRPPISPLEFVNVIVLAKVTSGGLEMPVVSSGAARGPRVTLTLAFTSPCCCPSPSPAAAPLGSPTNSLRTSSYVL
jgi:hypothetical protein